MKWAISGKAAVLCDGSFGSTGKGLAAAWLAEQCDHVHLATTNSGANAGHTTRYQDGRKFVCFNLPTTAIVRKCDSYINAGSIIDIDTLAREIADCGVDPRFLTVDPRASIITDEMRDAESRPENGPARIASTMKGVGAAIADKVMRRAPLVQGSKIPEWMRVGRINLNQLMYDHHQAVVVEVPQGLDLSLNHGLAYPYTTSRDCTVMAGLSDAGIHPSFLGQVCTVVRTFPIRVGHVYNEEGQLLGESGPCYDDSRELSWDDFPGVEPERTTVTKRVRRIFSWSNKQYAHNLNINRPSIVFLNFCNYLADTAAFEELNRNMAIVENHVFRAFHPRRVWGFGPNVEDVTDNFDFAMAWFEKRGT